MPEDRLIEPTLSAHQRAWLGLSADARALFKPYQMYPFGDLDALDPVTDPRPGLITPDTPVASIGSCFSHELKKWLVARGYMYVQTETGPGTEGGSARFGYVYNTACLRQVLTAALGEFRPRERWWPDAGGLRDPYRRGVTWTGQAEAETELRAHAAAVRAMVQQTRILICTPGLAEVWRNRHDRATFYTVPPASIFNPADHEHILTTVEENDTNLEAFYAAARRLNPKVQLIVSLSPVPLSATFRAANCIVADSVSKAVLRVAVDLFCSRHPEVVYFPSFELVRAMADRPFDDDNRHVRPEVVDRIMSLFMRHYGAPAASRAASAQPAVPPSRPAA